MSTLGAAGGGAVQHVAERLEAHRGGVLLPGFEQPADVVEDLDDGLLRPAGAVEGPQLFGRQRMALDHRQVAADDAGRGSQLVSEQRATGRGNRWSAWRPRYYAARQDVALGPGRTTRPVPGPTSQAAEVRRSAPGAPCANRLTAAGPPAAIHADGLVRR